MLQVFYDAPLAIQIHATSALLALVIGPFVLWRKRRDGLHRALGYIWVTEMVTAAGSSLFIRAELGVGGFGPIHLLSLWALYGLWVGVRAARQGRIREHEGAMRGIYLYGVTLASLLTLLPGRRLNVAIFGEAELLGLPVIGLGIAGLILSQRGRRRSLRAA